MDLGLKGRSAIVCASSAGFGFACAQALAREGVNVVLNGRDPKRLEEARERLAREIRPGSRATVTAIAADLQTSEGRRRLLAAFPAPDILVTNMGGPKLGDFREFGEAEWHAAADAYTIAPIMLIKGVIDGMIERRFGRIINIASRAVRAPTPFYGLSNACRAALCTFSLGLAREVAHYNVTVNNLLPGPFATERQLTVIDTIAARRGTDIETVKRERTAEVPAGRFGEVGELGAYCAFLCSDHAGFIVGQNLLIDGGSVPA
ncbi:MAG: SDR family oxidoreductase [Salinarimonadaceae bacterium]|nr:MAG: SDR family oxidoreductase [Salinarimonadaceae bacterium]